MNRVIDSLSARLSPGYGQGRAGHQFSYGIGGTQGCGESRFCAPGLGRESVFIVPISATFDDLSPERLSIAAFEGFCLPSPQKRAKLSPGPRSLFFDDDHRPRPPVFLAILPDSTGARAVGV